MAADYAALAVLIVDDEKIIRAGIEKYLAAAFPGLRCVHARNGQEALAAVAGGGIDLVLTDIKMPVLDGIGLLRGLADGGYRGETLIVSGYDDFAYAREALGLGVRRYILKPIDRTELVEAVALALDGVSGRRRAQDARFLAAVLAGPDSADGAASLAASASPASQAAAPRRLLVVAGPPRRRAALLEALAADGRAPEWAETPSGCLVCRLGSEPAGGADAAGTVDALAAACLAVGLAAFLSDALAEASAARRFVARAEAVLTAGLVGGRTPGLAGTADAAGAAPTAEPPAPAVLRLRAAIGGAGAAELDEALAAAADHLASGGGARLSLRLFDLGQQVIEYVRARCPGDAYLEAKAAQLRRPGRLDGLAEYAALLGDFSRYANYLLTKAIDAERGIDAAVAFVKARFREPVTMAMAANHISMNYTYFSREFRKRTGAAFPEFLSGLRMNAARTLLAETGLKVAEVAAAVGIADAKRFMKTFRAAEGLSPTEYRRRFRP